MKNLLGRETALVVICLVVMLGTSSLAQQNLLTNPGFETGDFTGWSVTGTSSNFGVNIGGFVITGTDHSFGTVTEIVHSGTYAGYTLVCGACFPPGIYLDVSQTVNITPGGLYTASFWVGNGSANTIGESDEILLNGQPIRLTTRPGQLNPGQYGLISGDFLATQAMNTLTFRVDGSGTGISGFSFDDFSLAFNSIQSSGAYVYLLQQNNNRIGSYQLNQFDGTLVPGTNSPFNTGASPVFAENVGPLVYVADQGSSQISAYLTNFNTGMMAPVFGSPFAAGLAPNAIGIDRPLHFIYAAGRGIHGNGAISGWTYSPATGVLTALPGSPFLAGTSPSAISFDRSGRHAYVIDTGNDQVLAFSVDASTGALTPLAGSPYSTGFAPEAIVTNTLGNYLYVANSGDQHISGYKIASDGSLTPISGSPFPTGLTPISMTFDSTQRFLYVVNEGSNNIWAYRVDGTNGALNVVTGSPFRTGTQPLTVIAQQGFVYANTAEGISAFQINTTSGALGEIPGSPLPFFGTAFAINAGGSGSAH